MIYFVTEKDYSGIHQRMDVEGSLGILSSMEKVSADTETTGLNPHKDRILSLQLGNAETQFVIDCTTVDIEQYRDILENKLLLLWNAKFDLQFFYKHGIVPHTVWDGFVAERLMHLGLNPGEYSASLQSACHNYLGMQMDKTVRGQIKYRGLDDTVITYAAGDIKPLERIMELQQAKLAKLGLAKAIDYENRFVIPLAYMEYCGIHLDTTRWKNKMEKDEKRKAAALLACNLWIIDHFQPGEFLEYRGAPFKLEWNQVRLLPKSEYTVVEVPHGNPQYYSKTRFETKRVYLIKVDYAGDIFGTQNSKETSLNWDSPEQMKALFAKLGVDVSEGIEAAILKKQSFVTDLIPLYLEYKEATKVTSTYGQNFLDQVDEEGRIHTKFQQFGTKTGRISSGGTEEGTKKVNLLNIPRDAETRACFTAQTGNRFISIDYSGQESFIMADITNDKAMLHELNHGEGDMHTLAAKMLYDQIPKDMPAAEVKKQFPGERQRAKSLEFAVFYGSQGKAIATNLNLSDEEAAQLYDKFMKGFSGLKEYQDFRRKDWIDKGYILINKKTGHRSFVSGIDSMKQMAAKMKTPGFWDEYRKIKSDPENPKVKQVRKYFKYRSGAERNSINYPVQGTGALCMKTAMIGFFEWLRRRGLLFKVLLCDMPYDEVCFEAPNEVAEECAKKMRQCMVRSGAFFVTKCKLDAEISYEKDGTLPDYWIH